MFFGPDLAHVHDTAYDGFVRAAVPHLLRRLRAGGIDSGTVVDLGCGGGIWAAALVEAGYDVVGVDVSEDMLAIARERAPAARFVLGSMHDVELPRCSAVTAIGEVVNYNGPGELTELFTRIRAALRLDGILLLDAAAPGREPDGRRETSHAGEGWTLELTIEEDDEREILTREIAVARGDWVSEEFHLLRLYPPHDVLADLSAAGFTPRLLLGGYGGPADALPPGLHAYVGSAI